MTSFLIRSHQGGVRRSISGLRFFLSLLLLMRISPTTRALDLNLYDEDEITTEQYVNGFVDTATCYSALTTADANGDRGVSSSEFPTFLQQLGPEGFLDKINDFEDLPLTLSSTFHVLSCLCHQRGGDQECCVGERARLDTRGASGEPIAAAQSSYLFLVCSLTASSIERVLSTAAPTPMPSKLVITTSPTRGPTDWPTANPTKNPTEFPTSIPTRSPSDSPSPVPTKSPTSVPTKSPSSSPTPRPTSHPTLPPTTTPTNAPTTSPSESPTASPTSSPTPSPSKGPTLNPTNAPTTPPTAWPTTSPSVAPSVSPKPSSAPSLLPTESAIPTDAPTKSPSAAPSSIPSQHPSSPPSGRPTITFVPTHSPSVVPTNLPTATPEPTQVPSAFPTEHPSESMQPSFEPSTPAPSLGPSALPSFNPTTEPLEEIDVVARTAYSIAVDNAIVDAIPQEDYIPDLIDAMDILSIAVWSEIDFDDATRRNLRNIPSGIGEMGRRFLEVRVQIPTFVDAIDGTDCPPGLANPETDRCEDVTVSVGLFVDEEAPQVVRQLYQASLTRAIATGRLQDALDTVNPNSPVSILQGTAPPVNRAVDTEDGLSVGGRTGLVLVALAMFGFLLGLAAFRRTDSDKPTLAPLGDGPHASLDSAEFTPPDQGDRFGARSDDETVQSGNAILGATRLEYGKHVSTEKGLGLYPSSSGSVSGIGNNGAKGISSNLSVISAGSSGWSSMYDTSINTSGSFDRSISPRLVDLGTDGGAVHQGYRDRDPTSLAELDNAIQAGDWAAVGTSAAFLAASSYETASQSTQVSSIMSREKWRGALNAERAAELDKLIAEGDWEGVVQAASRFEAELEIKSISESGSRDTQSDSPDDPDSASRESGSRESGSRESGSLGSLGSMGSSSPTSSPSSPTNSGAFKSGSSESKTFPSAPTSLSGGSTSKGRNRQEVRKEVIALVERVVPEELEHVDEMMAQFRGREEELVETLRNMLERAIAQRARKSINRQVKLEAREMARENRKKGGTPFVGTGSGPVDHQETGTPSGPTIFVAADGEDNAQTSQGGPNASSTGADSTAVDDIMADTSGTISNRDATMASSVSSGYAAGASTADSDSAEKPPRDPNKAHDDSGTSSTPVDEARQQQLRHEAILSAIEAGDWEAVGEAAAILSDTEESKPLTGTLESSRSGSTSDSSRGRRDRAQLLTELIELGDWTGVVAIASQFNDADKTSGPSTPGNSEDEGKDAKRRRQLQEEKDALEQAEMWMQIAEQSKQEGNARQLPAEEAANWAIAQSLSQMEKQTELEGNEVEKTEKDSENETQDDEGSV